MISTIEDAAQAAAEVAWNGDAEDLAESIRAWRSRGPVAWTYLIGPGDDSDLERLADKHGRHAVAEAMLLAIGGEP